jgi:transposase-like protein
MARAAQRPEFWATVVAEAQAGSASHADIAAKHGVTEAALKYHFYKARKPRTAARHVPVLPVRVGDHEARQMSVELGPSLRVRFAEGCDPAYVAALVAKLR